MGFTTIVHLTLGFSISSASILANGRPSDTNSKIGWKGDVHLPIPTPNKAYNYSCRPRNIHFESIDSLPGIQRLDSLVSHPGYERILVDLKRIFFVRRKGPYPIWHSCSIARYMDKGKDLGCSSSPDLVLFPTIIPSFHSQLVQSGYPLK